jgi:hypothetical protein
VPWFAAGSEAAGRRLWPAAGVVLIMIPSVGAVEAAGFADTAGRRPVERESLDGGGVSAPFNHRPDDPPRSVFPRNPSGIAP